MYASQILDALTSSETADGALLRDALGGYLPATWVELLANGRNTWSSRLPFDVFKIDRQFVSALETDRQAPAIVEMILAMAETLGLKTVAEGVETTKQAEFLRRRGCSMAQGFLYSPGLPETAFLDFLRAWHPGQMSGAAADDTPERQSPRR